jgi:serine protease Do
VKPGDVIVEVTQERVTDPQEVLDRVAAIKKSGRKSVLLLISDAKGGLRFVAVPMG